LTLLFLILLILSLYIKGELGFGVSENCLDKKVTITRLNPIKSVEEIVKNSVPKSFAGVSNLTIKINQIIFPKFLIILKFLLKISYKFLSIWSGKKAPQRDIEYCTIALD
jgi:hypothetical protein